MEKALNSPVRYLKGVGPKRADLLAKMGIATVEDLLYYFPRRYEDRTNFVPIAKLQEGNTYTIRAKVLARDQRHSWRRRFFSFLEAIVADETGKLFCVWFNQSYLKEYFKPGQELILYGKVERYGKRLQMSSPEFELVNTAEEEVLNVGRIVPVYSLPQGIGQRAMRKFIKQSLDDYMAGIHDFLPYDVRSRNNLLNLAKSLLSIHFPQDEDSRKAAYTRLSFEEFFIFQLPLALRKMKRKQKLGISHKVEGRLAGEFINCLPFKLTKTQEKVIAEIKSDMASPFCMQRLLQGDVGSGKTVVAAIAGIFAIQGGYQVALMVPTEILAKQHYDKLNSYVSALGKDAPYIKTALVTGSLNSKEKEKVSQDIKSGRANFIIGTHALLEEAVQFNKLGLAVIDEQHKFGVGQRALLPQRGYNPDILIMTATPIPRTLAITMYADMDISVIEYLPPGRLPVKTRYFNLSQRQEAYALALRQLELGNQVYIVYPVIEESYGLDMAGAKKMYQQLKSGEFKDFKTGLIHGRMKQPEQDEAMRRFKERELDILVSTTILEVGIDIPTATCMIVENAERFGLSQLHQLRGRIGRGAQESFCFLISDAATEEAQRRIQTMVKYEDGFRIAEEDLKIRGPGEFFGHRQHGLSELKIANPLTQLQLLKKAREEAIRVVSADPALVSKQDTLLKQKLIQRFPEYEKLMMIG